jgi:hypothetical protein
MYRKQIRIPTIFALLILFVGIGLVTYLDRHQQTIGSLAFTPTVPEDIHISNISDNSFTVSFLTSSDSPSRIQVTTSGQNQTFFDDLDNDNNQRPRKTHVMTAKNLFAQTSYSILVITGNTSCTQCPIITQVTSPKLANPLTIPPLHGSILKDVKGNPGNGALVYAQVGENSLLSSRVDSSGLWVIPLTNLLTNDLTSHATLRDEDLIQISVKLTTKEIASAVVDLKSIKQNFPVPAITIGNKYNFVNLSAKKDLIAKSLNQSVLGVSKQEPVLSPTTHIQNPATSQIDILFPKQDTDTTTDPRPRIRGIAKPYTQILITVNSTTQNGKVTASADGSWYWRPPKELPAGNHTLTISTYNTKGELVVQTRTFIVLKSGLQVLGDSTPSASLTPTEIPTETPSPTAISTTPLPTPVITLTPVLVTNTPVPTQTPAATSIPTVTNIPTTQPRSGSWQPAVFLLGGGGTLLLVGSLLLIW